MIIGRWLEQTRETVQIYNSFSHLLQSQPKKIDFRVHLYTSWNKINKTEVLVSSLSCLSMFKYVMSFETLTKVDQLTEIVRF